MKPRDIAQLMLFIVSHAVSPVLVFGCGGTEAPRARVVAVESEAASGLCDEQPSILDAAPSERQTQGCVVNYVQQVSDPAYVTRFGAEEVQRRYVLYVPEDLPDAPVPVVFVFPGYTASAEDAAVYYTHTRFETLASQHGFIVVYGNGLAFPPDVDNGDGLQENGGYLQGCFLEHSGEGIDVRYTREILGQLESELLIDRSRVYATGLSAGGGLSFQLAIEAPDLVAAVAPVAGLPFQPGGDWLMNCNPAPGYGSVSIAMLAATDDPFIAYEPGPSREYPASKYPGMEQTRDVWLSALGISGEAQIEQLPDTVDGDSYEPHSGMTSSYIERLRYPLGPDGQELSYYRAVGMGHAWPSPVQTWSGLWEQFGKTNQDVDFADEAWAFFQRHTRAVR